MQNPLKSLTHVALVVQDFSAIKLQARSVREAGKDLIMELQILIILAWPV